MSEIDPEIRARAAEEARAVLAAVLADKPAPKPKPRRPARAKSSASPTANRPRPDKYDRQAVVRMYVDQGMTVKRIADEIGAHRGTVSKILTETGVPIESRRGPYSPQEKCQRGHDMSIHGKPNTGGRGGRYCAECKRMRERVNWKKADAALRGLPGSR